MKIVCDACSAKYSIADEKVRGKVFKIRCKKCRNVIVVRGTALSQESGEESGESNVPKEAVAVASDAVWHLVVDQEQKGPMTGSEIRNRFGRGEIDGESYIWREGFSDWKPLREVTAFSDLASAGPEPAPAPGVAAADGDVDEEASRRTMELGSHPSAVAAAAAAGLGAPEGESQEEEQVSVDLFAATGVDSGGASAGEVLASSVSSQGFAAQDSPAADPAGSSDSLAYRSASSATDNPISVAARDAKLTRERNESSVLFSLNNLAALAGSDSDSAGGSSGAFPAQSSGSFSSSSPRSVSSNSPAQEGSGLIDIRSMASSYLGDTSDRPDPSASDELPVFTQASFAQPASVLLPSAPSTQGSNKILYGVIGLLGIVAILLVVVLLRGSGSGDPQNPIVAAGQDDDRSQATRPVSKPRSNPALNSNRENQPTTTDPAGNNALPSKPVNTNAEPKERLSGDSKRDDKRDAKAREREREKAKQREREREKAKRDNSAPATTNKGCLDEVSCLLADRPPSCCKKYGKKSTSASSGDKEKASANSKLPETLSRSDIAKGMGRVRGRVRGCGKRHSGSGTVKVYIKVGSSGKVSSVSVKSSPSSSLGSCVASAVRRARFPRTQKGRGFTYPFRF